MTRHYEITDGNLHVGWASEDYMFTKMDERVLKGEANFNVHVCDRDAVDVVPVKHGHWEVYSCRSYHYIRYICSECRTVYTTVKGYQYCPNCGAKIDKKENNYITDIK